MSTVDLDILFARHALGPTEPRDFIRWAEQELLRGADSTSLEILAGLDTERSIETEEVLKHFRRCLREIGVE